MIGCADVAGTYRDLCIYEEADHGEYGCKVMRGNGEALLKEYRSWLEGDNEPAE